MAKNIFECAKFGDKFATREESEAVFIKPVKKGAKTFYKLIVIDIHGDEYEEYYKENGLVAYSNGNEDLDIVSSCQERASDTEGMIKKLEYCEPVVKRYNDEKIEENLKTIDSLLNRQVTACNAVKRYQDGALTMNVISAYINRFAGGAYLGVDDGYIYVEVGASKYDPGSTPVRKYFVQYYGTVNLYPVDEFEKFYRNREWFNDEDGKALPERITGPIGNGELSACAANGADAE